jgi:hypothetical protein
MSAIRAAFKALSPEQQAIVTGKQIAGQRSPDEWLSLLAPVAEFDRQVDAVRLGAGGFWARRFARKHDLPIGLRLLAVPLLPILREDHNPSVPLELRIDLTGAQQKQKLVGKGDPHRKGAYYKVVDTFYNDPWLEGRAQFVDGADVRFVVTDLVRSSRKTKRTSSGKFKRKTKAKKKAELAITVSFPARNYGAGSEPHEDTGIREVSDSRTVFRRKRTVALQNVDGAPSVEMLIDLFGQAYGRVDPTRKKKL